MSSAPDNARTESNTYDIIFAGGGAAACVQAGRLAEADPNLKILIVEAGPHTRELHDHIQPGRFFSNLVLPAQTFSHHIGTPSEKIANRAIIVPSGRALGGGSSVNFAVYTRAAASDYDDWENVHGNKGWGSKDIIPLLKKAETYQAEAHNDTHGKSGPIKVSFAKDHINVTEDFLEVAAAYDRDRGPSNDLNAFHYCDKYARWARYIDTDSGRRSDTPHHYIYNQIDQRKNLHIMVRRKVVRVIFEGTRAVGVEYVDDVSGRRAGVLELSVAYASRLVVVSAGAFGSPSILERSGIGAANLLKKNDIQQVVDLPGVGENYMDHNLIFAPFFASEDADTLDPVFRGTEEELEPYIKQWLHDGQGLMAHNSYDAGIKLRPTEEELKTFGPAFQERWKSYFANAPDKPVMLMGLFAAYAGMHPEAPRRKYYSIAYYSAYPSSLGRVHITSGLNPYAKLNFEPGFLNTDDDVEILKWAYIKGRELARRIKYYRGEFKQGHPRFAEHSQAACKLGEGPNAISAPDIQYSAEDEDAIDDFHRQNVETTWHSVGTCAMKPRDQGGVVDERLNVYGVQGLKVADVSITPGNVGANTYNTALAIGEKAAVIIAEDLGIKGVTTS